MREIVSRRRFLMASSVGIVSLGGCSQTQEGEPTPTETEGIGDTASPTPTDTETATQTETVATQDGQSDPVLDQVEYFLCNVAGSRTDEDTSLYEFGYRSQRPLQMETDVGGSVSSQNSANGIELRISLTEDDGYGSAGVNSQILKLSDISRIQLQSEEDLFVGIQMGISYNNGTIFEWEQVSDNRERTTSLDGDDTAIAGRLSGPTITINRDDQVFSPQSDVPDSLADLEEMHGNIPVRVFAALNGGTVPWAPEALEQQTELSKFIIE